MCHPLAHPLSSSLKVSKTIQIIQLHLILWVSDTVYSKLLILAWPKILFCVFPWKDPNKVLWPINTKLPGSTHFFLIFENGLVKGTVGPKIQSHSHELSEGGMYHLSAEVLAPNQRQYPPSRKKENNFFLKKPFENGSLFPLSLFTNLQPLDVQNYQSTAV